jgi:DNA-binding transcriptional regulator PaaX
MSTFHSKKTARKKSRRIGAIQQKILLLLLGGLALSCTRSPSSYWRILKAMKNEWKEIGKQATEQAINALYESRLVKAKENADGTHTLVLSDNGRKRALTYKAKDMKIERPPKWDKKWRVILFDIPEDEREARDALRDHLTYMGFYGLQKSASVHPFDCRDQIDFLVELYDIRKYVRFIIAEHIDNEEHLKRFFKLEISTAQS